MGASRHRELKRRRWQRCDSPFVCRSFSLAAGSFWLLCFTGSAFLNTWLRQGASACGARRALVVRRAGKGTEGSDEGDKAESEEDLEAAYLEAARNRLTRTWQADSQSSRGRGASTWATLIDDYSKVGAGSVLLGDPREFAGVASRAGLGGMSTLDGVMGFVLKMASWLGIGGMDMVADLPRWKRSRWLPVVLLTERRPDGSGQGVALTARTGRLLGDLEGMTSFMTRPLHWGGPEKTLLRIVHTYAEVQGARPLGSSGLYYGGELASAMAWVTEGQGSSLRFRFFIGEVKWGPGELDAELEAGKWAALECDADILLDESEELSGQPLWTELATAAGGSLLETAKAYNLLGED